MRGGLKPGQVRRAAVFSTFAFGETANAMTKSLLKEQGITVEEECYTCKGKFLFFNMKHPNGADLDEARKFAVTTANKKR